jgi:site-specific DNA recombinase
MPKTKKSLQIKSAGYIRVSSKEQTEGESLSTQRQSIKTYIKQQGWKLTDIYADEGISGGSIKERHALLQLLQDGQDGKFNILVIHRLSRFGRNARELLNNHDELSKVGIDLRSISEGIDFGNKYGKAMLGMFAVMAEL